MSLPLATSTWDDAERAAIHRVVDSGRLTMGPEVQKFEREFAEWLGSKYCVMVNSGSTANLLATAALFYRSRDSLKPGDTIIAPACSWSTSFFPLAQYGLKIKFVDINPRTLNYDVEQLGAAVDRHTRAVLVVNLLGNPNDFDNLSVEGLPVIEDNCESMGAIYNGKRAGTFGLVGTHSTFFSHHMCTIEGGIVNTDDEEIYHILLALRAHGWTRDLPKRNLIHEKSENPFEESFKFILPGYSVRPTEISGALGQEQLKKLNNIVRLRRDNAAFWQARFTPHPHVDIQQEIGESSWFGFSMVVRPGAPFTRDQLVAKLNQHGYECRPIVAGNFLRNPVIKHVRHSVHGELKNADYIHDHGLFVGNHHYDIRDKLENIGAILWEMGRHDTV